MLDVALNMPLKLTIRFVCIKWYNEYCTHQMVQYQWFRINGSVSLIQYHWFSIIGSVSMVQYQWFSINGLVSLVQCSVSLVQYQWYSINGSVSMVQYHWFSMYQIFLKSYNVFSVCGQFLITLFEKTILPFSLFFVNRAFVDLLYNKKLQIFVLVAIAMTF